MTLSDLKAGKLARENFAFIPLFNKYKIDFFCKGNRGLAEALAESGADREKFLRELEEISLQEPRAYPVEIEAWPLDLLADYIQKIHHRFTDRVMLEIKALIGGFRMDGTEEARMIGAFKCVFEPLAGELATHMKREELMLFPAIKRIAAGPAGKAAPAGGSVDRTIETMIDEHDMQYQALKKIRAALGDYALRENKDDYNKIVKLMRQLDLDLPLHIHLENNILFPKALELANQFNGSGFQDAPAS